jgi:hypothetical protein
VPDATPVKPILSPIGDVVEQVKSAGLGFDRVDLLHGSTYKDNATVVVIPTRGSIPHEVVQKWLGLIQPMNGRRAMLFAHGHEVGHAYNEMIKMILGHPELSKWPYILTLEDDNIPPVDAHVRLLESIDWGGYDAISGLYFTKGEINMPMAYGDPDEYRRTGVLDFRPRNVADAIKAQQVMPVNGIAMGCALWKMSLFREIPPPWYVTVSDVVPGKGIQAMTQDLYFCERAVRAGKRFATDCRVHVGHMDMATGIVY